MASKVRRFVLLGLVLGATAMVTPSLPAAAARTGQEDFFLVSSIDLSRGTIVLKRPTEVTLTMRITEKTRCRSENGKPIRFSDLRAGDTVFIASQADASGQLVASTVRQGIMTLPELRRRYLDRPPR